VVRPSPWAKNPSNNLQGVRNFKKLFHLVAFSIYIKQLYALEKRNNKNILKMINDLYMMPNQGRASICNLGGQIKEKKIGGVIFKKKGGKFLIF
jgi:hypothetical protein